MVPSRRFRLPACVMLLASICACVPRTVPPAPLPAPPPRPAPPPEPPVSAPAPAPLAWQDGPLAAGDWTYAGAAVGAQASFGTPGGTVFALRCDSGRQIGILPGAGGPVTIVTSFGERAVPGSLPASDPLFDQLAFSRGRFLVRTASGGDLVLPSWPEPARLIEDCRA